MQETMASTLLTPPIGEEVIHQIQNQASKRKYLDDYMHNSADMLLKAAKAKCTSRVKSAQTDSAKTARRKAQNRESAAAYRAKKKLEQLDYERVTRHLHGSSSFQQQPHPPTTAAKSIPAAAILEAPPIPAAQEQQPKPAELVGVPISSTPGSSPRVTTLEAPHSAPTVNPDASVLTMERMLNSVPDDWALFMNTVRLLANTERGRKSVILLLQAR
jgi:hypothetical protein